MRVRMHAPINPRPVGSSVRTPSGRIGTVVDYECPNGAILYVVDVPEQLVFFFG